MRSHEAAEAINNEQAGSCVTCALIHGSISAVKAAAVSGGLFWLTWKSSPFFRTSFNASSRTALLVMPVFYTLVLNMELKMHE